MMSSLLRSSTVKGNGCNVKNGVEEDVFGLVKDGRICSNHALAKSSVPLFLICEMEV